MLQRSIETLDREDFKVLAIALEDTTPLERFVKSLPINNNTSPFSLANILVDPKFAYLLQESSAQFDQVVLDLLDTIFQ